MRFIYSTLLLMMALQAHSATELSKSGITWTFDQDYETGQFCNGDYWVVGPVRIIAITNSWHTHGFVPSTGQDGSMINPPTTDKQGYDNRINSYDANLNVAAKGVTADAPLQLVSSSSLISTVSWLYTSKDDTEPGCPKFNGGTKTPRPVIRNAEVLTCLDAAPPEGSFRPPYCGTDKTIRFNKSNLKQDLLKSLPPVSDTPKLTDIENAVARPWIDHVHEYLGAFVHPSENMPEYGANLSKVLSEVALMLHVDFAQLPGHPSKEKLLVCFVQIGIDWAGVADNGGSWPSNGGHHMGRKWPILFAGLMLNDQHMKNVGQWDTAFQEDDDTFYVSQAEVDLTHSGAWTPDGRASRKAYETEHIGMPDWGIRHVKNPLADNMAWDATYRNINNPAYVGWVLAAQIMGQKQVWNHDALFDYVDRSTSVIDPQYPPEGFKYAAYTFGGSFVKNMWKAYRSDCGPIWMPNDPSNLYSPGALKNP